MGATSRNASSRKSPNRLEACRINNPRSFNMGSSLDPTYYNLKGVLIIR